MIFTNLILLFMNPFLFRRAHYVNTQEHVQ
nr:MAG TPA: hypothetical protein [Caudoviricetes sp.]